MRRALGSVAVAFALTLAMAACGGTDTPAAAPSSTTPAVDPASIKADLTWWDTSDATNEAPEFKKLITQFNKTYPNVHIDYQSVPFGEAQNKFKNAAQAKSGAPDILRADVGWVAEFASLGYLYNLDDTDLVKDQQDFLPVPLASTKFNGKTYGVPQVTDSLALMYNKKLLQQAGVQPPKTWDEMVTASATIKQKTGKDGTFLNPAGYYLLPFIYGEGGDLVDAGQKKIVVNAPEAVAGAKKAAELVKKPGFTKPPATDAYNAMMTAFKGGKVAMIVNGPWELNNIKSADGFGGLDNLGLTTAPAGTKKSGTPVGGHDYVVWSGMPRDKAAAAIAFIKFMSSADTEATIANDIGLLPPRSSAYAKVTNPVIAQFKPMMDAGVGRAWIPEAGQLFAPMDEAATKIMVQGVDPQTALNGVAKTYKSEVVPSYAGG